VIIPRGRISKGVYLVDVCFSRDPHLQSRESYERLVFWYRSSNRSVSFEGNPNRLLENRKAWMKFREKHLARLKKERGTLRCEYCGRGPLRIRGGGDKSRMATLDHAVPLSGGGGMFDEGNLKVSCLRCNKRKDRMPYWRWNVVLMVARLRTLLSLVGAVVTRGHKTVSMREAIP
jgi:hypothetical protein